MEEPFGRSALHHRQSEERQAGQPPRDLPDRVIRQALGHPANLRAFLQQAMPALAAGFDCDRRRLLERQFPLDDWRRREADLPFEIPYRLGEEEVWALVYVLIEHQSGEDPAMPLRLLYFVVLYWERQWREWEQAAAPKSPWSFRVGVLWEREPRLGEGHR